MTATLTAARSADPIALQLLFTRLDAIAEEGVLAIERTAISPAVAEAKDCTCTILGPTGDLLVGGGALGFHFGAANIAIKAILDLHGDSLAPGDVFFGNDPHSNIAIHTQDVMVAYPVFAQGTLAAWMVASAHMIDLGGMKFGSWAPDATECYQEAIRMPPVRLYRAGVEQVDVWAILRNNIRVPTLVEMDIRALIAGCYVAGSKLVALIEENDGIAEFAELIEGMGTVLTTEFRRRIATITEGTYRATGWSEWSTEFYKLPCALTVENKKLVFDFAGAPPQCEHFINSKPWIIKALLMPHIHSLLAIDLPLSQALYDFVELRCPEGSVVNSRPPAPVASSHIDVGGHSAAIAISALLLAIAASPDCAARDHLASVMPLCNHCLQTWSFKGFDGNFDGFLTLDGSCSGGPGTIDHDGADLQFFVYGKHAPLEIIAAEVYESWYPVLIAERRVRPGTNGAGRFRAGGGAHMSFEPYGVEKITGVMIGSREHMETPGFAGGFPGGTTNIEIRRASGEIEQIAVQDDDVTVYAGERFSFSMSSSGGYGDPLDREPASVLEDVLAGRLTADEAKSAYGVILSDRSFDGSATATCREALLAQRLADADPAAIPLRAQEHAVDASAPEQPFYPGIVQRGSVLVSERSGALLAIAPGNWTDGCPVLRRTRMTRAGVEVTVNAYLDPLTGHSLAVDSIPSGEPVSFGTSPARWRDCAD